MRGELRFDGALDLEATLLRTGAAFFDPTTRVMPTELVRALRTPEGPATWHARVAAPGHIEASAWGPGAAWVLANARALLGLDDASPDPDSFDGAVRALARRAAGVRLARAIPLYELLVVIVLEQLVAGAEAYRAYANLVRRFSEPAPGPYDDLWLPLGATEIRALAPAAMIGCGVLPLQAATLQELARRASRVEEAATMDADAAERRLMAFPGVGVWTARNAMLRGLGHADAVPLGDYGLARIVAWNLRGEEHADDERMLALLAPYAGQRGRVIRWMMAAGSMPPRRAPRARLREIHPISPTLLRVPRR